MVRRAFGLVNSVRVVQLPKCGRVNWKNWMHAMTTKFISHMEMHLFAIYSYFYSPLISFDMEDQRMNLNTGKFSFTIHCVTLV